MIQTIKDHLSPSELKSFARCEAESVAVMSGKWDRYAAFSKTTKEAITIGRYVDAYFQGENEFQEFLQKNESAFYNKLTKAEKEAGQKFGKTKALVATSERLIERLKQDQFFMKIYQGNKQKELWGELYGLKFHGFADCITDHFIIDLKTLGGAIDNTTWNNEMGKRVSWIEDMRYYWQLAIYQELYRQETGKQLDTIVYAVTKEEFSVSMPIKLPQSMLDYGLNEARKYVGRYKEVMAGSKPKRCEKCAYCRATKQHFMPVDFYKIFEKTA